MRGYGDEVVVARMRELGVGSCVCTANNVMVSW